MHTMIATGLLDTWHDIILYYILWYCVILYHMSWHNLILYDLSLTERISFSELHFGCAKLSHHFYLWIPCIIILTACEVKSKYLKYHLNSIVCIFYNIMFCVQGWGRKQCGEPRHKQMKAMLFQELTMNYSVSRPRVLSCPVCLVLSCPVLSYHIISRPNIPYHTCRIMCHMLQYFSVPTFC